MYSLLNATPAQINFGRDMLFDYYLLLLSIKKIENSNKRIQMPIHTKRAEEELNMSIR
jgi:hypothetical protein